MIRFFPLAHLKEQDPQRLFSNEAKIRFSKFFWRQLDI